jgi:hypothetical protein
MLRALINGEKRHTLTLHEEPVIPAPLAFDHP